MSLVVANASGPTTVTLPFISVSGIVTVKDSGSASSTNIVTIQAAQGNSFETGTSYTLNTPSAYVTFVSNPKTLKWRVIGSSYADPAPTKVIPTTPAPSQASVGTIGSLTVPGQATLGNTNITTLNVSGNGAFSSGSFSSITANQAVFLSSMHIQGSLSVFSSLSATNIDFTGLLTSNGNTFSGAPAGINSAGNVGIGAAAGAPTLLVTGSQSNTGTLGVAGNTTFGNTGHNSIVTNGGVWVKDKGISFKPVTGTGDIVNNSPWYGIGWANKSLGGGTESSVQIAGYTGINFVTGDLNQAYGAGMSIVSNRVGILNTSPQAPLDVSGNAILRGDVSTIGNMQVQGSLSVFSTLTAYNVNFTNSITSNGLPFAGGGVTTTGFAQIAPDQLPLTNSRGICFDPSGNMYVADSSKYVIYKITPTGVISLFAGTYGVPPLTIAGTPAIPGTPATGGNDYTTYPLTERFTYDTRYWSAVASSENGNKLVAVVDDSSHGYIYTSTDSGVTWVRRTGPGTSVLSPYTWKGVTSSVDGNILFACVGNGGQIWKSTNAGETWAVLTSSDLKPWSSIASSSDGTIVVAVSFGPSGNNAGGIYRSTDSGVTWRYNTLDAVDRYGVALSTSGNIIVAVGYNSKIFKSTDLGATWVERATTQSWKAIASSSDGIRMVAVVNGGRIWTSTDSGDTWIARAEIKNWYSVASSADGKNLVAVNGNGEIHTSINYGVDWVRKPSIAETWNSVASSADGSKLVTVTATGKIYTIAASGGTPATPATPGTPAGPDSVAIVDGTSALFGEISNICYDSFSGSIMVASVPAIRAINLVTRQVTTLAGTFIGSADGTGSAAYFNKPAGICSDGSGALYIADCSNNNIRKLTFTLPITANSGVVTTIAGSTSGYTNATGTSALFNAPSGIVINSSKTLLWVADTGNHVIRQVTLPGAVTTTLAGANSPTVTSGYADSTTPTSVRFNGPQSLAIDASNNLFVADYVTYYLRYINTSPFYTLTLAGGGNTNTSGVGKNGSMIGPSAVALDPSGSLWVITYNTPAIFNYNLQSGYLNLYFKASATRPTPYTLQNTAVSTIVAPGIATGTVYGSGYTITNLGAATYTFPRALSMDSQNNLYVCDQVKIRKITPSGFTTSIYGDPSNIQGGLGVGTGSLSQFSTTYQMSFDNSGNMYFCDAGYSRVNRLNLSTGVCSQLPVPVGSDGTGCWVPAGILFNNNTLYIANRGQTITGSLASYIISVNLSTNAVTLIAGSPTVAGGNVNNATGTSAKFNGLTGMCFDATKSNLLVTDYGNNAIRVISLTPPYAVSTLSFTGSLNTPVYVIMDSLYNLYVSQQGAPIGVIKIPYTGSYSSPSISYGSSSSFAVSYQVPEGITVDSYNNIYFADSTRKLIYYVNPSGTASVYSGVLNTAGTQDSTYASSITLMAPYVGINNVNPTVALHVTGALTATGSITGASKNFKIPHPVLSNNTLIHASIEGPRYDLLYRNRKQLVNGSVEVDLEKESTSNGATMTEGTFDALATNPQVFLQNNDTFDRVKGYVSSHVLFIECENSNSSAFIDWMVTAERHDPHVIDADVTDASGFLVLERSPAAEPSPEPPAAEPSPEPPAAEPSPEPPAAEPPTSEPPASESPDSIQAIPESTPEPPAPEQP